MLEKTLLYVKIVNITALCSVVKLGIQMLEKLAELMSVDEITILRLVGEENIVVGHCLQFCKVFLKQFLSLGSEAIFNLRPNKRTFAFY